jgi:hypothetical protein
MGRINNFVIFRILKYIAGKFDGYKSFIAGLGSFIGGVVYIMGAVWPSVSEITMIPGDYEKGFGLIVGAFTVWGIAGKIEKAKK